MRQRKTHRHPLSRRAISCSLASKLFAQPLSDHEGYYWVKYLKADSRTAVLVRPDRRGQQSVVTVSEAADLFDALDAAMRECSEKKTTRRLRRAEVVVFELDNADDITVTYRVVDLEQERTNHLGD